VDIRAGDRAVELMKHYVAATNRSEVIGGLGGFAGLWDASALKDYRHPVLATSTDGVGTKVAIAQALDIHDTVGYDLVGMVVDDLVVVGAKPLFMTDYIACGKVVPERIASIVKGIAAACVEVGVTLLGGETAEHPGLLGADEYDVAGAATAVVERDALLGAHRVCAGDSVIALASSGLHSNGFSLVRKVLLEQAKIGLDTHIDELGRSLGEELLTPTRLYTADCLAVIEAEAVHALSHITGGGLANNLARVIPDHLQAVIDRSTWVPAPIFTLVQRLGAISQADVEETLNMGVGMVIICPEPSAAGVIAHLGARGVAAWQAGEIGSRLEPTDDAVRLVSR
jgi:phosphoribosylformylglycinamidine cyclo-ligase